MTPMFSWILGSRDALDRAVQDVSMLWWHRSFSREFREPKPIGSCETVGNGGVPGLF